MNELSVLLSVSPIIASRESIEKDAASTWFLIVVLLKNSRGRQRTKYRKWFNLGSRSSQGKSRIWLKLSGCHGPLEAAVLSYSLQLQPILEVSAAQLEGKQKLFSPEMLIQKH